MFEQGLPGWQGQYLRNDRTELLAAALTPGKRDDRRSLPKMTPDLVGKLFGDRGYISPVLVERRLLYR